MHSSSILTLFGAALAVATPLAHDRLHKKAIVYDIVTDIVYVTVTEGELPTAPTTVHVEHTVFVNPIEASSSTLSKVKTTSSKKPTSTYVPPPPAPTTTTIPPAPTTTSEAPAPTTEASTPATTTEAAPVETTTQAPVVAAPAVAYVAPTSAVAVASSTPAASTSDNSLASTGVGNHNTCRSSHSAGGVTWNDTLASYAAITAKTCVFAHDM
jgi:uncharacterized protein YkwD